MALADLLGHSATLFIRRFGSAGAFLAETEQRASPDESTLLLLGSEIPKGAKEGDAVRVFVHLDSEGRPIATTRTPKLELGEVAFLTVTACTNFGAFVDWGLAKELLVPFAEQSSPLRVGESHAIGLYIDATGRLAGTTKVSEQLSGATPEYSLDEWVHGEAWRNDREIGLFVIVERTSIGLLPAREPHSLLKGHAARFRVAQVFPDGKIELSLRAHAHEELASDARRVLERLSKPDAPRVGDRSDPEKIRVLFGLSKKAFKRAVGRLMKQGAAKIDDDGYVVVLRR